MLRKLIPIVAVCLALAGCGSVTKQTSEYPQPIEDIQPLSDIPAELSQALSAPLANGPWTCLQANAGWSARFAHTVTRFKNKFWLIGGGNYYTNEGNEIWNSTDGKTWTLVNSAPAFGKRFYHQVVVLNNKMYLLGGFTLIGSNGYNMNDVWSTVDGINWTRVTASAPWSIRRAHAATVFNGKMWVSGGGAESTGGKNDVWSSPDGLTWTCATPAAPWTPRAGHNLLAFNNKLWVMGGAWDSPENNEVWYSSNGTSWTRFSGNVPWTARQGASGVVASGNISLMGGYGNGVQLADMWTFNGATWTKKYDKVAYGRRYFAPAIASGNMIWIFGGQYQDDSYNYSYKNDVWSYGGPLPSGNWTIMQPSCAWSGRLSHTVTWFNNKFWLIGGGDYYSNQGNEIWNSTDGANWTLASSSPAFGKRFYHQVVVLNGKMYLLGGFTLIGASGYNMNDVWSSTDGINWTRVTASAPWTIRRAHAATVFGGKMWVAGGGAESTGGKNDVWSSADGLTWTCATAAAPWSRRAGLNLLAYNSKLWVMGGAWDSPENKDLWYSTNGTNWIKHTGTIPWAARQGACATVYDSKIYLMGGYGNGQYLSDMWAFNGTTWTQINTTTSLGKRYMGQGLTAQGGIWLFGGSSDQGPQNDTLFYY